ncbi:MAG TPA: lipase [Pirellulaceae bacterium]|nr:lipase [Pirellulaceae bacterium]
MRAHLFVFLAFAPAFAAPLRGEDPPPVNVPLPTLGGEQFWSDELVYQGWRIQQNVLTQHYRLLDPRDVRRAWGTAEQCRAAFAEFKRHENLPPLSGRAVVTLHGLIRSRDHMDGLGKFLAEEGKYHVVNVSYASTRRSLDDHALSLSRVLAGLEGVEEIDFVGHSLGNLVVRRYLGEASQSEPRWQVDPRIKRMVMLGPPNNGARLAVLFRNNELFGLVTGPSGKQLARSWDECQKTLATPSFPFGILAGGSGNDRGLNPLVPGDDDLIVSVEETRLAGAADFRLLHCRHALLMDDPAARACVLAFLQHGYFTAEGERQPIVVAAKAAP